MNNKKIILISLIIILISTISLLLSFSYLNNSKSFEKINKIERIEDLKKYSNDKYNFTFNYPNNLVYTEEDNKKITAIDNSIKSLDKVITFRNILDQWIISIDINKTEYKNIEDWLDDYVKNKPREIIVFRENSGTNIDNNKTIITHVAGLDQNKKYVFEDYPYEKTIGFIKDSNLFVINIKENIGDQSYIEFLKSFRFTK